MLSVPIFETVQAQGNAFKSANFDFAVVTGNLVQFLLIAYVQPIIKQCRSSMFDTPRECMVALDKSANTSSSNRRRARGH